MLTGGTLLSSGCGDLVRRSLRDGALALIAGSAAGYFDFSDLSNMITNTLTGGFTGGWSGFSGGWSGFGNNWGNPPFTWPSS